MNKFYINVEEGIHYLGQKPGFYKQFEHIGNCIVDKVITGCGATTEALIDDLNLEFWGVKTIKVSSKAGT